MIHEGVEQLFGPNRDHHRRRKLFGFLRHFHFHSKSNSEIHENENDEEHHFDEFNELEKLFLKKPNLEKFILSQSTFTFASMQGWRSTMEDRNKHLIPFDQHFWKLWSYFSIFDGHNGIDTAKFASEQLDIHLLNSLNQMLINENNDLIESDQPVRSSLINIDQLELVIKQTYFQLDQNLRNLVQDQSGSVCITCLIGPEQIYLINIGDSRAIIISNQGQVLIHTEDHKPDDPNEQERIHEAGGKISKLTTNDVLRVENQLAMTRVLGDYSINKQIVPPMADIIHYPRNSLASFIVLACDGIWDVMTNEEVASFIIHHLNQIPFEEISSKLLDECLRRQSTDNMTVYIIKL